MKTRLELSAVRSVLVPAALLFTFVSACGPMPADVDCQGPQCASESQASSTTTGLGVVTWNILWFGDKSNGPTDEQLQADNVRTVMSTTGAEIYGLQEVIDSAHLSNAVARMSGWASVAANSSLVINGPSLYSATSMKPAVVYNTAVAELLSASIITELNTVAFTYRPPLRADFRIRKDGVTRDIVVLVVHLKAGAEQDDWQMRADSSRELKAWLDRNLPTHHVLVIGDFNDQLTQSIAVGDDGALGTPFKNFLDDKINYTFITEPLALNNITTMVRYNSAIDHQLASNEIAARLVAGSMHVVRPDQWAQPIANYGTTTSDHYPVFARYSMGEASTTPSPVVTVLSPNGGERLVGNQSTTITWSASNVTSVRLEYTVDGTSWTAIATVPATDGSRAWTVPNVDSSVAKVRVSDANNAAVSDVSDAAFSIARAAATVFINEILYDEPGFNYDQEFVELVNHGTAPVDLSGWSLHDSFSRRHLFPTGTSLGAGKAIVVFGTAAVASASGLPNAVGASTGTLSLHPEDAVSLRTPAGAVHDSHSWTTSPGDGVSVNRSPDATAGGPFVSHQKLSTAKSSAGKRVSGSLF